MTGPHRSGNRSRSDRKQGLGRRRNSNGQLIVIYWRDIPAQVNAGSGPTRVQRILPRRFQSAIDHAATVAGKTEASQYVGEWRRVTIPIPDPIPGDPSDLEAAALQAAARFEAEFSLERLNEFVKTGGWDPAADLAPAPKDAT